jgi:hypothetical protein
MTHSPTSPVQGRAAPVLILCRQCIEYVFEGTTTCPHCGGNAREIGSRYCAGGYVMIEAMQRLERAVERRGGKGTESPIAKLGNRTESNA